MKAYELAEKLLAGPNLTVVIPHEYGGGHMSPCSGTIDMLYDKAEQDTMCAEDVSLDSDRVAVIELYGED